MDAEEQRREGVNESTRDENPESRPELIDRVAVALDYSYATELYGVKLLRTVLGILSDDTLHMLDKYLSGDLEERRAVVTRVMADYTEEELREIIIFGDAFGLRGNIDAIQRILAGLHALPELSGMSDLSRFDTEGRQIIRAVCAVQGAVYRNDTRRSDSTGPYRMNPSLFKILMANPELSGDIVKVIDESGGLRMRAVNEYVHERDSRR
jgi:hypothetical protein